MIEQLSKGNQKAAMCCFFDTKSMAVKNPLILKVGRKKIALGTPTAKKLARGREDASFQTFHDQKLD